MKIAIEGVKENNVDGFLFISSVMGQKNVMGIMIISITVKAICNSEL